MLQNVYSFTSVSRLFLPAGNGIHKSIANFQECGMNTTSSGASKERSILLFLKSLLGIGMQFDIIKHLQVLFSGNWDFFKCLKILKYQAVDSQGCLLQLKHKIYLGGLYTKYDATWFGFILHLRTTQCHPLRFEQNVFPI